MERKVAIVGAGISGLLACKYTLSKGFNPLVFESHGDLGGVWAKTFETTRLQTPKQGYQFSDFPWPSNVEGDFPTGDQVWEYVRSYAEHFDLMRHVRFNTKVLSIDYEGVSDSEMETWSLWGGNGEPFGNKGKWTLQLQDVSTQLEQVMQFNFVILCIGQFSDLPNIPEFPPGRGPENFRGMVMHSKDYAELDCKGALNLIKRKRVVVVGYHKSALDIATECSIANGSDHPCHLMYRTPKWVIPDFAAWGFPISYLFFSRFAELLTHKPGEGIFLSLVATLLSPLKWLISKFVESSIRYKHPLKKFGLVPEHNIIEAIYNCFLAVAPKYYYESIEKGSIIPKKVMKFSFYREGVMIDGEEKPLEVDLVIFATGFKGDMKLRNIFASQTFQGKMMGSSNSIVPLYRQCINPRIPQLAVIGFGDTTSNVQTSEIRCRWVVELLDGTFKIPGIKEMEKDILEWNKFMKRYSTKHFRRTCITAINIWFSDQLCKDMGWNPKRKKGLISELFAPYGPLDYTSSS